MATYTSAVTTPAPAAAAAYATLDVAASRPAYLRSFFIGTETATYSPVGLVYPNNTPVATTSTTPVDQNQQFTTATASIGTAWSTAPTIAGGPAWLDKIPLGPAVGASVFYPWPNDAKLGLAKSAHLVFWNYSGNAASALSLEVQWDE